MDHKDYDVLIGACLGYHSLGRRTFVSYRNGLTKAQSMVMNTLSCRDGLSMKRLGGHIRTSKEQLSRVVTSLEEKGLVKRERPQENKRTVKVFLTQAGRDFLEAQLEGIGRLMDDCLAGLDDEERSDLLRAARRSNELLRKALGEGFEGSTQE